MNKEKTKRETIFEELACIVCATPMQWEEQCKEWICPQCGNRAFQTEDCGPDEIYYEYSPEDLIEENL